MDDLERRAAAEHYTSIATFSPTRTPGQWQRPSSSSSTPARRGTLASSTPSHPRGSSTSVFSNDVESSQTVQGKSVSQNQDLQILQEEYQRVLKELEHAEKKRKACEREIEELRERVGRWDRRIEGLERGTTDLTMD